MLNVFLVLSLLSTSTVTNVINNQVNSASSTTKTEITTNVNGSETKVTSDQPGTISVENINGQVKVEADNEYQIVTPSTDPSAAPEIITSSSPAASLNDYQSEAIFDKLIQVFTGFWKNISKLFVSS